MLSQITSKIFWAILVVALLAGGYIFVVKTLVKPPQLVNNNTQPVLPKIPKKPKPQTRENNGSQPANQSANPGNNADNNNANNANNNNAQPAIAQPEGVIIQAPKQLEKGGLLKIYVNTDRVQNPDPLNSSPIKIIKTDGLELISLDSLDNFQQAEGFFLVPKPQSYNFVVSLPENYRYVKSNEVRIKIDGIALSSALGGKAFLEKGYHKITLFNNHETTDGYPTINWAAEGEEVKPLNVFREVGNN